MTQPCHTAPVSSASDFAPETHGLAIDALIKQDHEKVRYLFTAYEKAQSLDEKQRLAYNIVRELSIHSSKEEDAVYPAFAKVLGTEVTQHALDEHYYLKVKLQRLSNMDIKHSEEAFDKQVATVRLEFNQHSQEEEQLDLPRLMKSPLIDPIELGVQFQKATAHAVTRPHPDAPDKPPMSVLAKTVQAPIDALADAVRFSGKGADQNLPAA